MRSRSQSTAFTANEFCVACFFFFSLTSWLSLKGAVCARLTPVRDPAKAAAGRDATPDGGERVAGVRHRHRRESERNDGDGKTKWRDPHDDVGFHYHNYRVRAPRATKPLLANDPQIRQPSFRWVIHLLFEFQDLFACF